MIFVIFGNSPEKFYRLARKIDELAKKTDEKFIVQSGFTDFRYKYVVTYPFLSYEKMQYYISKASIIISHGGYGTISECLKKRKKIVIVPRIAKEHIYSQKKLVDKLVKLNYIIGVYNIDDLELAINKARKKIPIKIVFSDPSKIINNWIKNIN